METAEFIKLIGDVGFIGAVTIGAIWKLNSELDKRDDIYNERHQEMKAEIKELREMSKQEKNVFANAVTSFDNSVREFTIMSNKMINMEHDVKEIRNDIRDLKKQKRVDKG